MVLENHLFHYGQFTHEWQSVVFYHEKNVEVMGIRLFPKSKCIIVKHRVWEKVASPLCNRLRLLL